MKTVIVALLAVLVLSACAGGSSSALFYDPNSKYETACGTFYEIGMPAACACLNTEDSKKSLGEGWATAVSECRKTAGFLSDQEIASLKEDQACALSRRHIDTRIDALIKKNHFLCDPIEKSCAAKGYKTTSSVFADCVQVETKKANDPAFAYCINSGFKTGTQPMATCLAMQNSLILQRQQNNAALRAAQQQQRLIQQQQNAAAMQELGAKLLSPPPAPPPPMNTMTTTKCRSDYNSSFTCN